MPGGPLVPVRVVRFNGAAMAKKRIQPSDEEIARRAMDLARQVSGRLFVSRDGVYLVSGMPAFRKLRHCLASLSEPPGASAAPTPMDLGFAPGQVTPLTGERLTAWGRGLQKWRKILNDYEKPRQKTSERRHKYRRWKDEIDRLSHTLEHLWQTLRLWEGGRPIPGAPYASEDAAGVAGPGAQTAQARMIEPLCRWLERLVVWIAGPSAGLRFRESLRPLVESPADDRSRDHFAAALRRVQAIQGLQKRPPKAEMAAAVRDALAGIPEELRDNFGLQLPQRPSESQIDRVVSALERAVAARLLPPVPLVGSAAALCAADGAAAPVPAWLLTPCGGEAVDARTDVFVGLFEERAETGYDPLLRALAGMRNVSRGDLPAIRRFLAAGVEASDITWALKVMSWRMRDLAAKGLSPQPFRTLAAILARTGLKVLDMGPGETDLDDVVEKVAERGSADIVEAFALWLSSLGPAALDANLAKWAWNCLCQLLVLEGASPALRDLLGRWADPPVSAEKDDSEAAVLSPEARVWSSKLGFYQRMCGQQPALPESVTKMLDPGDREAQELQYLRKARSDGRLSERMAARLALLEDRGPHSRGIPEPRILKQLQEVCAHAALEAVRYLSRREGRRVWAHLFGCEPQAHLTDEEITAIAAWATGLDKTPLKCLQELLEVWRESGAAYRGQLSLNAAWTKASADHIGHDAWFSPDPMEVAVDGLPVTVCVAPDPFRALLMGTYFGTCLSLDDFNKDSVLANAYDANKAVVFALGAEGKVLARKLVCISTNFHLVGYRTYVAADESLTKARREGIAALVDAFCGRWARRVGLPLGFSGTPAKLSRLFWYDDGVVSWSASAMRAWADSAGELELAASIGAGLMPQVAAALESRRDACVQLLSELGIWPPAGGESAADLADAPGLAEESLAVLARAKNDGELARVVFQNATTPGGQLEAMTSVALVGKTDEMVEHVFSLGKRGSDQAERAMEVLRCVGSKKAWQLFMKLAVRQWRAVDPLWLPHAAADSDDSANALFEALMGPGPCDVDYRQLLVADGMVSALGKALPQAAVLKTLLSDSNGSNGRCFIAQWAPACPDALKRSHIERIATRVDEACEYLHQADRYASMAAVIVAMKSPGPRAAAYLRGASENDPSALLALSLRSGGKYRDFIRKTALAAPAESASILALLASEGEETATELLAPAQGNLPNQKERLDTACRLFTAYRDLDSGKPVSCFPKSGRSGESLPTLPFILHWLWKWMDAECPNIEAIGALMGSDNCTDALRAYGVDLSGFAARLAGLLRRSDGETAAVLREALLRLLDQGGMRELAGYALLMDKLSGGKLWSDAPTGGHAPVPVEDVLGCAGAWELLLDDARNPRPVFEKLDWSSLYDIRFPMNIRSAARVARLISAHAPADELAKSIRPMTEMQKHIVARYIKPKGD